MIRKALELELPRVFRITMNARRWEALRRPDAERSRNRTTGRRPGGATITVVRRRSGLSAREQMKVGDFGLHALSRTFSSYGAVCSCGGAPPGAASRAASKSTAA